MIKLKQLLQETLSTAWKKALILSLCLFAEAVLAFVVHSHFFATFFTALGLLAGLVALTGKFGPTRARYWVKTWC